VINPCLAAQVQWIVPQVRFSISASKLETTLFIWSELPQLGNIQADMVKLLIIRHKGL
jgi:hypothetical protein